MSSPAVLEADVLEAARRSSVLLLATSQGDVEGFSRMLGGERPTLRGQCDLEGLIPDETRAWIEAADLHEKAAAAFEAGERYDYVFCLDPWATSLIGRGRPLWPDARWVSLADHDRREYRAEFQEWIESLRFDHLLSVRARPETPRSWQWKKIIPRPTAPSAHKVTLFVRHAAHFAALRVLLDSVVRQEYPPEKIEVVIFAERDYEGVSEYLKFLKVAHPRLACEVLNGLGQRARPVGMVVMLESDVFLPPGFMQSISAAGHEDADLAIAPRTLALEAAAHILTGNLDPLPHYRKLWLAQAPAPDDRESVRIVPPEVKALSSGPQVSCLAEPALLRIPELP